MALRVLRRHRKTRNQHNIKLINFLRTVVGTNLVAAAVTIGGGLTLVVCLCTGQSVLEIYIRQICINVSCFHPLLTGGCLFLAGQSIVGGHTLVGLLHQDLSPTRFPDRPH